jgi:Ser/Thr protein kinase RdoA (MazF antagonist)
MAFLGWPWGGETRMLTAAMHDPAEIAPFFDVPGTFLDAARYGNGHINDTFACRWRQDGRTRRYILQRLNRHVFADPPGLMENVARVTRHLRRKRAGVPGADPNRDGLTLVPTRAGGLFHRDDQGDFWRAYLFIEDTETHDVCTSASQAYEAARAFGQFQRLLADLPGGPLHATIPFFHHAPRRLEALERAVAEDRAGRVAGVACEIEFARRRRDFAGVVTQGLDSGALTERVTHNDTKLNNILMDRQTGGAVCVIDLDTVMTGSVLYDFGDMVRSCARQSREDEPDPENVGVNLDVFSALVTGYLEVAGDFLTPAEIELLAASGRLMAFTLGVRFLTDYLEGDVYFRQKRPGQNLDRVRVHFKLVSEMEALTPQMEAMVRRAAGGGRIRPRIRPQIPSGTPTPGSLACEDGPAAVQGRPGTE